jgi:hypothetical protein
MLNLAVHIVTTGPWKNVAASVHMAHGILPSLPRLFTRLFLLLGKSAQSSVLIFHLYTVPVRVRMCFTYKLVVMVRSSGRETSLQPHSPVRNHVINYSSGSRTQRFVYAKKEPRAWTVSWLNCGTADRYSVGQKIPWFLWEPQINLHVHRRPSLHRNLCREFNHISSLLMYS